MKPATELPWARSPKSRFTVRGPAGECIATCTRIGNAEYVSHAANAYPRLVTELIRLRDVTSGEDCELISVLLRELGELAPREPGEDWEEDAA